MESHKEQSVDTSKRRPSLIGCAIIDVDTDSRLRSDSIRIDDESATTKPKDEEKRGVGRKPSMIQMTGDSSSNDEDAGSSGTETKQAST